MKALENSHPYFNAITSEFTDTSSLETYTENNNGKNAIVILGTKQVLILTIKEHIGD